MDKQNKFKSKSKTEKAVNEEAELLKAQLVRTLADYDNLVKRVEREKGEIQKVVSLGLILRLLSVLDNLESAQVHLKDQGLAISIIEFKKVLSEEGLTEIKPGVGDKFDEQTMEVIEVVSGASDNDESHGDRVHELVLVGWKFEGGTVVRHAKVKVERSEK
jgi:molecular chaperone GrpE